MRALEVTGRREIQAVNQIPLLVSAHEDLSIGRSHMILCFEVCTIGAIEPDDTSKLAQFKKYTLRNA